MSKFLLSVVILLVSAESFAFIPPLPSIVRDMFEGRKPRKFTEIVLRHRVNFKGDNFDIEERMVGDRGRAYLSWRVGNQTVHGVWERQSYQIEGKSITSRSSVFMKYLLSQNPDELLNQLIAEQFVRKDQLAPFKAGFAPEGDPNQWDIKGNYVVQHDIYMRRLKRGVGIAVLGMNEENAKKTVVFEDAYKGLRRLEWLEGNESRAWNFDGLVGFSGVGTYPKHASFEVGAEERVMTELVSIRVASDSKYNEMRSATGRNSSMSGNTETALSQLLGFR